MVETTAQVSPVVEKLVDVIIAGYAPEKIILFGSYAYGNPDENSDVDLLIVKKNPEPKKQDRWLAVHNLIWDMNVGIPVSPLVISPGELEGYVSRDNYFVKEILKRGIPLYEKDG